MKDQYEEYKAKLNSIPYEERLPTIYRWTKGGWIKEDVFIQLVQSVIRSSRPSAD